MTAALLDINDCNVRLWRDGAVQLESPGYAWLEGRQYRFGLAARSQARRHPRDINHRFWWQLNLEPLQPKFGPARHSADLVHAHLQDIHRLGGQPERLVFAAPGSLQADQLSLLLGIAQQCPFDAVGLVERAVACTAGVVQGPGCWHVNLQLHQALVTQLTVADGQLQRQSVTPIPGCGWLAVQDSLANTIAQAFINQTRFDPRNKAATEQDLYDQLPGALQQLQEQSVCNVEVGGHRVRLEGRLLVEACRDHYERIHSALGADGNTVFLDASIGHLPAIVSTLPNARVLPDDALAANVAAHAALIEDAGEGVHFITRLPVAPGAGTASPSPTPVDPDPVPAAPSTPPPSPAPSRVELVVADGQCTVYPGAGAAPRVNGVAINGPTRLTASDVLELGDGRRWRLSEVLEDDGPQT